MVLNFRISALSLPVCLMNFKCIRLERKEINQEKSEGSRHSLIINHDDYLKGSPEKKRHMHIKTIIDSIKIVKEKSKGDFSGDQLIEDIVKALNVTMDQLNLNQ